jgi:hypothetical protein
MSVDVDRSLELPKSEYFAEPQAKSGITLHHTVCDDAHTTVRLPFEDGDTLGLEYLLVPAWFAETFIIDHANAASWRAQKDRLLAVDSLRSVVATLQNSVTRLVAANLAAYATGYDAASASYQDLSRRYIAELNKPRIRLPSLVGLVGAAGIGLVIGRTIP